MNCVTVSFSIFSAIGPAGQELKTRENLRAEELRAGGPAGGARAKSGRKAESEQRRARIVEAARDCFGSLGFARAKVETIAAEAGVSNGLLYRFFRNKRHLFEVVIDELERDWVRAMLPGAGECELRGDELEEMFRRSVAFAGTHPLLPALLTEDIALELRRVRRKTGRLEAFRRHVAGILRGGIAAGEFKADLDADAVADVICQLQVEFSTRAYRHDPQYPSDPPRIDAAVRFIRDAVAHR